MTQKDYDLLSTIPLFFGLSQNEICSILTCIHASEHYFSKKEILFSYGDYVKQIGIILSGQIMIEKEDFWGNRSILSLVSKGSIFAETYALLPHTPLEVQVVAQEECHILYLDFQKVSATCTNACSFHTHFIHNLLSVIASKNYMLTKKVEHMSQKTTRDKLLSFLSTESQSAKNSNFVIPYNRQQLADYLSVDRSALSNELGKLKKEGILDFHKNTFRLTKK